MESFNKIKKMYRAFTPLIVRRTIGLCKLYVTDYDAYKRTKYWREQKRSYGNLNSDKKFYVLRKYPGATGLLSCYLTYLGRLELIADTTYIPIIDMMSNYYPMSHNSEKDLNRVNAWEQFFKQLSDYDLKDVYSSRNVILGGGTTEHGMELFDATVLSDKQIQIWHDIDKKYMRLNQELIQQYEEEFESSFGTKRIIGVMIREGYVKSKQVGSELIKGHPVQPNLEDVIQDLHRRLDEWNCEYIFLSTETTQTLDALIKNFGDKLLYTKRIRRDMSGEDYIDYLNKSKEYLNSITVQQRNIDYLKEVYLLSKCTCLVCGKASATVVASIWNGNKYERRHFYELGIY